MTRRALLVAAPAEQQIAKILAESETSFGRSARERYAALITTALEDLLDDPYRLGSRLIDGRIHYHLRHSRNRVSTPAGRVGTPRHLVIARLVGDDVLVLAVAHDGMVADLARRIEEGEGS